jgi:hypothetical protein
MLIHEAGDQTVGATTQVDQLSQAKSRRSWIIVMIAKQLAKLQWCVNNICTWPVLTVGLEHEGIHAIIREPS